MAKKILFILLICTGYCSLAVAQAIDQNLPKHAHICYYKNSGEIVLKKDSADYFRITFPSDKTDRDLYVVKEFYVNGKPKMIGKSAVPFPNFKKQGVFVEYFKNGQKKRIENFENGSPTGDILTYYPNGKLYHNENYDAEGNQFKVTECGDSTGNILAQNGNGRCINYDADFKLVTGEGPIANGLKDGEWHGDANDSVKYVCIYNNGISVSGTSYERSGKEHHFTKDIIDAEYEGGMNNFYSLLRRTLRYPAEAKEKKVQGVVLISFAVGKDGTLSDYKILQSLGSGCDEEVVKLMKSSPPWTPECEYGIITKATLRMPVSFTMVGDY
jgi:TonB family protein